MFEFFFGLTALIIFGVFARIIFQGIRDWNYNRSQPRLKVEAAVVTKRSDFRSHHGGNHHHHSSTYYYVTFEFSTGDRKEFEVGDSDYGLLREDDRGQLTFQGNRFIAFERKLQPAG